MESHAHLRHAFRWTLRVALAACTATSSVQGQSSVSEVGLDLFGLSWHYDSPTYWNGAEEVRYQERNPGIGLHLRLGGSDRHLWMLKLGGYEDSMRNRAAYAGPVWQYRVVRGLHAGGGVLWMHSATYVSPVIPMPLVSYRVGRIGLNLTWIPAGDPEASGAFALFGTIVVWRR